MFPFYTPTVKYLARRSGNGTSDPLNGLRIETAGPDVQHFSRIEEYLPPYLSPADKSRIERQTEAVLDIYTNVFGVTLTEKIELTSRDKYKNKVWSTEWVGPDLKKVVLKGTVTHRVKPLVEIDRRRAESKFCVEFNASELNQRLRQFGQTVPYEENMTEKELRSGLSRGSHRWIVPDKVTGDRTRCLVFETKDFSFEVQVNDSTICAGKGLFVTVRSRQAPAKTEFVLKKGRYVDFGVYAPHSPGHLKPVFLFDLKSVVTDGRCEVYAWGCGEARSEYVYDVSDDITGDLKEVHSVFPYVNEAKSCGEATMLAEEDKAGAIHCLLGSPEADISFVLGKPTEITINYGTRYEIVRLRNNYSRAPTKVRDHLERNTYHVDILEGVGGMDHDTVAESIKYFTKTYGPGLSGLPHELRHRFFSVILTLHARMRAIALPGSAPSRPLMEAALRLFDAVTWGLLLRDDFVREVVQLVSSEALSALIDELSRHVSWDFRLADLLEVAMSTDSTPQPRL